MKDIRFTIRILSLGEPVPPPEKVSAVFLIALFDNNIVAIRNHRGWDIPAGHLEPGEGLLDALRREAREEASMQFSDPIPFVTVTSTSEDPKYADKCMVGFAAKDFTFETFVPAPDSEERKLMDVEEFLSVYQFDKENMRKMIEAARLLPFTNEAQQLKNEGFKHIYGWTDKPGTEYPPHKHQGQVTLYIVGGGITFFIDGKAIELKKGERFDVPVGKEHTAKVGEAGCSYVVGEMIEGDS